MTDTVSVTLKLFASLGSYLPGEARKNTIDVLVEGGTTMQNLLDRFKVPPEACHLVMLNGVFQAPRSRASTVLTDGDALAVWPPVAGG